MVCATNNNNLSIIDDFEATNQVIQPIIFESVIPIMPFVRVQNQDQNQDQEQITIFIVLVID